MDVLIALVLGAIFGVFTMSICVVAGRESRREEQADPCFTCLRWDECNGVDEQCPLKDKKSLTKEEKQ